MNQKIKSDQNNINAEEGLLDPDNKEGEGNNNTLSSPSIEKIKNKFTSLNTSISNMEAFYHSISLIFQVWMRFIKANEYKSHIYTVKTTKEIYDTNGTNNANNEENNELVGKEQKPEHFLSQESYLNIRLILI